MKKYLSIIFISIFLFVGFLLEIFSISLNQYTGTVLFIFYLSLSVLLWSNTLSFIFIFSFTLILEAIGITTSFPFGHYVYGNLVAFPSIMNVPLFIPLAWFVLISATSKLFHKWYFAGIFIILFDIILEHFATVTGLWTWPLATGFLTAPIQNYLTWGVVASIGYLIIPKNPNLFSLSKNILILLISYMVIVSIVYLLKLPELHN